MRNLFVILIALVSFLSCTKNQIPEEVTEGVLKFKITLGDFNFTYSADKKTMYLNISDCSILDQSDREMTEIFCSGMAYHLYISLNENQLKEFSSIKITTNSTLGVVEKVYTFEELALVQKFDYATYEYFDHVAKTDIATMYTYMDNSVRYDVDYNQFEGIMLGGFEDSQMQSIELAGYNFLTDNNREVLHIRYVLRYESGYNRRHSLYFLLDENNFLIDGFQL